MEFDLYEEETPEGRYLCSMCPDHQNPDNPPEVIKYENRAELWIKHSTMPPTEFFRLYADAGLPAELVAVIDALMTRKIAGIEKDQEPRIQLLHQFIEEPLQHYLEIADELPIVTLPVEPFDTMFQDMLKTVWADA